VSKVLRVSGLFVIQNELGLHARAAARMVQVARNFAAEVRLIKDNAQVDAKSILDVLSLAAPRGTTVTLLAVGPDAEEALRALGELIEQGFGEP
jgi:phosphocarrier protein HPr